MTLVDIKITLEGNAAAFVEALREATAKINEQNEIAAQVLALLGQRVSPRGYMPGSGERRTL